MRWHSRARAHHLAFFGLIAAIASIMFFLAACGDDDDDDTITAQPTQDASATETPLPNTAEDYAVAVFSAWSTGDEEGLGELATTSAIDVLLARGWDEDDLWQPTGCDGAAGSVYCQWQAEDGETLQLRIDNQAASNAEPHAAVEARFN